MVSYDKLTKAGMDMESLLCRLMGNEALVRLFIKKFIEDKTFDRLGEAFAAQDMKAAEMASHTLKGMCGNLSLMELYALFTEQVNLLRSGETVRAEAMMARITAAYTGTISGMNDWLRES